MSAVSVCMNFFFAFFFSLCRILALLRAMQNFHRMNFICFFFRRHYAHYFNFFLLRFRRLNSVKFFTVSFFLSSSWRNSIFSSLIFFRFVLFVSFLYRFVHKYRIVLLWDRTRNTQRAREKKTRFNKLKNQDKNKIGLECIDFKRKFYLH